MEKASKIYIAGGDIVFDFSKPDGKPRKLMNVSKLNAMGWKAKIGLREAIERVYKERFGNQKI